MNERRCVALDEVISMIYGIRDGLFEHSISGADFGCRTLALGVLIQYLHKAGIPLTQPRSPYIEIKYIELGSAYHNWT
jgi:hypothetical protein